MFGEVINPKQRRWGKRNLMLQDCSCWHLRPLALRGLARLMTNHFVLLLNSLSPWHVDSPRHTAQFSRFPVFSSVLANSIHMSKHLLTHRSLYNTARKVFAISTNIYTFFLRVNKGTLSIKTFNTNSSKQWWYTRMRQQALQESQ
jgi:hypothetical protein